eukprot:Filipodium_phascolosomae@DN432_c0_g1_i2.p1
MNILDGKKDSVARSHQENLTRLKNEKDNLQCKLLMQKRLHISAMQKLRNHLQDITAEGDTLHLKAESTKSLLNQKMKAATEALQNLQEKEELLFRKNQAFIEEQEAHQQNKLNKALMRAALVQRKKDESEAINCIQTMGHLYLD